MDFRDDTNVYDIRDQYLFGPALMVCPVTKPGATSREVSICRRAQAGRISGPANRTRAVKPSTPPRQLKPLPLFVRAGSIIPYGPAIQYAMETNRIRLNCVFIVARTGRLRSTRMKATIIITKRANMPRFRFPGTKPRAR